MAGFLLQKMQQTDKKVNIISIMKRHVAVILFFHSRYSINIFLNR